MAKQILMLICLLGVNCVFSQNIKRKAYLGISTGLVNDSLVKANNLKEIRGVIVTEVKENEATKALGISKGDILLSVNKINLKTPAEFSKIINELKEKDQIDIEFLSNQEIKHAKGLLLPIQYEEEVDHKVMYDEFPFNNGWIRTITDIPKGNGVKYPAILFVQGYSCFSMDRIGDHPYGQLIKGLAKKGYVVMRVEKPGEGDNTNTSDCDKIDFATEVSVFEKGLAKLKSYDFVDTSNVFIWGHSMGGIIAPIIASGHNVKGMIVYGTGITPWREYLVEMFRVQNPLFGVDYIENEANMIHFYNIIHQLFIEKKTPDEIAKNPVYKKLMTDFMNYSEPNQVFSRSYKYLVQIDDFNLPECWSKTDAYVLSMWGDCDVEAYSDYDQKEIVAVVNHYHQGHAEFLQIKNTTHAFSLVESMKHGIANYNYQYMIEHFNPAVIDETDLWIKRIINK
ncbi:MAG: PDZ domain-containing protein [Bacteroidota bacterium]